MISKLSTALKSAKGYIHKKEKEREKKTREKEREEKEKKRHRTDYDAS